MGDFESTLEVILIVATLTFANKMPCLPLHGFLYKNSTSDAKINRLNEEINTIER